MRKMKKLFGLILICVMLLIPMHLQAASVEPEHPSSLTIKYCKNGIGYEGVEVNAYRVAEVFEDGTYALTGVFAKYSVNINGIKSQTEWDEVKDTLTSYIVADKIAPTARETTDENGYVLFKDILPGIYLISEVKIEDDKEVVIFESFLVVVPNLNEDGTYNYDIVSLPKHILQEVESEVVEYKVVKQWKDYGKENERPNLIEVEIYKNGIIEETIRLSDENDWTYSWEALNDGSEWIAVEKNVPDGYEMTVSMKGYTILITNACEGVEIYPETGDQTSMWPYILGLCCSGMIFIIVGIWRKRKF